MNLNESGILVTETKFGFDWGGASVKRIASEPNGAVIITVTTQYTRIEIRVTKTGQTRVREYSNYGDTK